MRQKKPQLLVRLAAHRGEYARRLGIAEPCGVVDRLARRLAEHRKSRRQDIDVFSLGTDITGVGRQCRMLGYGLDATLGDTAERGDSLGEQIDKFFGGLCHLFEKIVETDEVRLPDVPKGL